MSTRQLFNTTDSISATVARLVLAGVILPHGYMKITHFSNTLTHLSNDYGLAPLVAVSVIVLEFFAPLLLLPGIGGKLMAMGIMMIMLGAIPYHLPNGFFMNWFHNQPGEGIEYHVLAIGLALVVMINGSGRYSIDRMLILKWGQKAGKPLHTIQHS